MRWLGHSISRPASTTNTMASLGISSPRASVDRARLIAQREGLSGPPVLSAVRKWAATAAVIALLTFFRSFNLCIVAMLGVASFFEASPLGAWIRDHRRR